MLGRANPLQIIRRRRKCFPAQGRRCHHRRLTELARRIRPSSLKAGMGLLVLFVPQARPKPVALDARWSTEENRAPADMEGSGLPLRSPFVRLRLQRNTALQILLVMLENGVLRVEDLVRPPKLGVASGSRRSRIEAWQGIFPRHH